MDKTNKKMERLKADLISELENSINYEITYRSISPSIFSFISIKDLVIYKDKKKSIKLAEIKSFKAFYSPFYFFKKDADLTPLQAVKRFNISNSTLYINQQRDKELINLFTSKNGQESSFSLFPLKTVISGRNIDVLIETAVGTLRAENLVVTLTPENGSYKTKLNGDLNLKLIDENSLFKDINSKISLKGSLGENFDTLNFIVKTKGFNSNIIDLKDQTFQVISSAEDLQIRKVQDDSFIDLAMRYEFSRDEFVLNFNAEKFRPESIFLFKESLIALAPYSSSEITGNGSMMFGRDKGSLLYSLNAQININEEIFNRQILVNTDLTGDSDQINVRSLNLRLKEGRILFSGDILTESFLPAGQLTLKDFNTPNGYVLNSTLDVKRDSGFLFLTSDALQMGHSLIDDIRVVLLPGENSLSASLRAEMTDSTGFTGNLTADTLVNFREKININSYININQIPVEEVVQLLPSSVRNIPLSDEILGTTINSDIYFSTDFKTLNFQIGDFQLISRKDPANKLTFTATYSKSGFKINDLNMQWDEYKLNGYVNSSRNNDEYITTTLFDLQDKSYRIQAIFDGEQMLLEGDYNLYGFFQTDPEGFTSFNITSDQLPIPLQDNYLFADLNLSGYFSRSDWRVKFDQTRFNSSSLYSLKSPEVFFTAEADNEGVNFYNFQYADEVSTLKGLGRMTYGQGDISSWLSLFDETGETDEQYDLFFVMKDGEIESRVSLLSSPLERLSESGLTGKLSVDLAFNGTIKEPDINAIIHTDQMFYDRAPIEISSFIRGNKDVIRISDLELNYKGIQFNRGLVLFEMNKGKLLATGAINQVVNNSTASTSITALIKADNSFDLYSIDTLNSSQLEGLITVAPVIWDDLKTFPQIDIVLKKDRSLITARIDDGAILDSSYNMDSGEMTLAVKDLFPVRLTAGGSIRDSIIDLEVEDFYFDPGFINYFMPVDPFQQKRHVVFKKGNITGDLLISGQLFDPDFYGVLNVNHIEVETPYLAESPGPASTIAYFDGHSMLLDPLVIPLKKGQIEILSNFEFDGALPTTYNVDVNISGSSGARVAYEIPNFSWDGHFTGTTHIEGSKNGGFLKGDLIFNDLETYLESEALMSTVKVVKRNPSVNGFIVDLTLKTGRDVSFYLPNKKVPIIQATAEYGDTLNIAYDSRSEVLALEGQIDIRTGEINYFNKIFYLQEGYIDFNESQVKFNPWLNVRADVVTQDDLGDDVTISLLFDDYLFNEFNPELLSSPSKSENEILALLGQSFIPSNDPDNVSVASLLMATGGMIGKNTIMQPFEEAIKSSLNLDFVSFNTDIIENAILARLQDEDYYDDDGSTVNFLRYLENTSLFVGEYIGDYLFLEGSLVVDYDESSVSSTLGGMELNLNLSLQFITPFVLIDWTYDPSNNVGSDYFLPQNTISFTWQYSY